MEEKNRNISSMYKDWFLDYASYVILERAIPDINDGLKPVQKRILHSMFEMNDGRYNKVLILLVILCSFIHMEIKLLVMHSLV